MLHHYIKLQTDLDDLCAEGLSTGKEDWKQEAAHILKATDMVLYFMKEAPKVNVGDIL